MTVASPTRPVRLNRAQAKAQTRTRLLESAQRLFVTGGYEATSLEQIAAEAGFTKGAMYFHFPSKEALFFELMTIGMRRQIEEFDALMSLAEIRPEVLENEFRRWLDRLDGPGELPLLGLELLLASRRNPDLSGRYGEALQDYQRALDRILDHYFMLTGNCPPIPRETLVATIVAVSEGLALTRQSQGLDAVASTAQLIRMMLGERTIDKAPS